MSTVNSSSVIPLIPVSWGELIDKITILEIKAERLDGASRLAVVRELTELNRLGENITSRADVKDLKSQLADTNAELWHIENSIRKKEDRREFDSVFIDLARAVYTKNDRRASLKRQINLLTGSSLSEVKSYPRYGEQLMESSAKE